MYLLARSAQNCFPSEDCMFLVCQHRSEGERLVLGNLWQGAPMQVPVDALTSSISSKILNMRWNLAQSLSAIKERQSDSN